MNHILIDQTLKKLCFVMDGETTFRYFDYTQCQGEYHISAQSLSQLKGYEQDEIRRMTKHGIDGANIVVDE